MNAEDNSQKTILLEFNELCPGLLSKFREQGLLPNFQRLYESSTIYTTDAQEAAPQLEPWIQWMTVHSGMHYAMHGAFHLGDGRQVRQKCLATLLSEAGVRVGVFGSMNTNYERLNGYYVPDPWESQARPNPAWLAPFFTTVSKQVQAASGNDGLGKQDLIKFGLYMLRRGLRARTVKAILKQLADERRDNGVKWRRASLLEKIQYDLFAYLDRKFRPQFATFFCNSTAHYQHYFWRNMHPEIFEMPPDGQDHPSLQTAILYGYQEMDKLIGWFLKDFSDATLILCTALSQQPWTDTTKCTFRPRDFRQFLDFAGIAPDWAKVEPVMAEEFRLNLPDETAAIEASCRLSRLQFDGSPLMKFEVKGNSIFTGCAIQDARAMQGRISDGTGQTAAFRDYFHMVNSVRSGRHHPHGVLWVGNGQHRVVEDCVSLSAIAPAILKRYGAPCPDYMNEASLDVASQDVELAFAP
jgi:hypothetical protein